MAQWEMDAGQLRAARKLIRSSCANYDADHSGCYLLDEGDGCTCPQCISYSQICNYFRDAVLPLNPELLKELVKTEAVKRCGICGKAFIPRSNRQMYCEDCAAARKRNAAKERMWKARHSG